MKLQRISTVVLTGLLVLTLLDAALGAENLDRGLVALPRADGSVFLSWRLLATDAANTTFAVLRRDPSAPADQAAVISERDHKLTHCVDKHPVDDTGRRDHLYELLIGAEGAAPSRQVAQVTVTVTDKPAPYITIPLDGDYDFQKVGVGDLDGDGALEYVIKQPNFNTDPYQQPGYWKPSTTTYKIEAYRLDGTMMWRHDMGWSIEAGAWYSPWIVYDVDGDGKAEVYCKAGEGDPRDAKGLVQSGPEYLAKLDGETGRVVARTNWISRDGYRDYNFYCRNFLTVAYLDGKTPSLIMQRGTYKLIKTQALDKDFNEIWRWASTQEKARYAGQGAHTLISADVDRDGRDELVLGSAVLDDTGRGLWANGMGHPDACYVADIDPNNPGLEIYCGLERSREADGLCVVDARTGRKLWGHKEPTSHVHSQGMVGDLLAEFPGMEVYGGEQKYPRRWLYSSAGELIEFREKGTLIPRPVWWDADPQKEVVMSAAVRDWGGPPMMPITGRVVAVMDCLGDHREEIITSVKGELRIYTTPIPADTRRPCLLQNHHYRMGVVAQTMGYYHPAQFSE